MNMRRLMRHEETDEEQEEGRRRFRAKSRRMV